MAQQLIYTSASKLLDAGRSGFGTVARSKSLSPLLVSAIERVSQFANIRGTDRTRVIFVHRRIIAANNRVHILSRIADSGADYTGRTNHIAHHLIVTQEEMTRAAAQGITPADVLMQFPWLQRWDGAARFFGPEEDVPLTQLIQPSGLHSARAYWGRVTGNPLHARLLCWEGAPRNGVLIVPRGVDPLGILAEALTEFGTQSWSRTFTTSLETTDEMSDLDWVISSLDNFHEIEGRCGARARLDLTQPQSLPVPPEPVKAAEAPAVQLPAINSQAAVTPAVVNTPRVEPVAMFQSGNAGVAVRSPRQAAPAKSNHAAIILIASAAAVALLIILSQFIFNNNKSDSSVESDANVTSISDQSKKDSVAKKLIEKRLSEEVTKKFVEQTNSDLEQWAIYTCELIELFGQPRDTEFISKNLPTSTDKKSSVDWVRHLHEANDDLFKYNRIIDETNKTDDKLKLVHSIHNHLIEVAKRLEDQPLSEESADRFCEPLIKHELNEMLKLSKSEDQKSRGLLSSWFDPEKNAYAYEILKVFVSSNFESFIDSPLHDALVNISKNRKSLQLPENTLLEEAAKVWQEPETIISAELKNNAGKGFIPEKFIKLLEEHRAKNQGVEPINPKANPPVNVIKPPSGPDLTGIKDKEIIIISAVDIKNGVEVRLLKKLFTSVTKEFPADLEILVDEEVIKNLTHYPEHNHFADNWEKKPKYSISDSGKILIRDGCKTIAISYKKDKSAYQTYIVTDEDKQDDAKPIFDDLTLEFRDQKADQLTISGDLEKWILAINPDDLKLDLKNLTLDRSNGELIIKIPEKSPKKKPNLVISAKSNQLIQDELGKYVKAAEKLKKAKGKKSEGKIAENELKDALVYLKDSLQIAVGSAILAEALVIHDESKIEEKHIQESLKIHKNIYGGNREKSKDWNKDIKEIKMDIGDKKLDYYLKMNINMDWKQLEVTTSPNTIKDKVTAFLGSCQPAKETADLKNPFDAIKSITVSSKMGRILFKAVK